MNKNQTSMVFVYGTLMRKHHNHTVMTRAGGEFICNAKTVNKYPLKVAGLPYLFNEPGTGLRVTGELYNITTEEGWNALDSLEGHPTFYKRGTIEVKDEAGNVLRVSTYFITECYSRGLEDVECSSCYEG